MAEAYAAAGWAGRGRNAYATADATGRTFKARQTVKPATAAVEATYIDVAQSAPRSVGVDEQREDVNDDERARQQTDEPVDVLDREPRPARRLRSAGERQAEHDGERQQAERDEAARTRDIPLEQAHVITAGDASRGGRQLRLRRHRSLPALVDVDAAAV